MINLQHLAKPKDGPAPRWFHIAVAASMIISALSALIATVHTGRTMSALVEQNAKLVKAGSTPILEFGHGNIQRDRSPALEFTVSNVGSGLARVVWFELRVDGKAIPTMYSGIKLITPGTENLEAIVTSSVAGRVFAPGTHERIFTWPRPIDDQSVHLQAWKALDSARFQRISVEACYCSVFQECWLSNLAGDMPKPVSQCSAEGRTSLQG